MTLQWQQCPVVTMAQLATMMPLSQMNRHWFHFRYCHHWRHWNPNDPFWVVIVKRASISSESIGSIIMDPMVANGDRHWRQCKWNTLTQALRRQRQLGTSLSPMISSPLAPMEQPLAPMDWILDQDYNCIYFLWDIKFCLVKTLEPHVPGIKFGEFHSSLESTSQSSRRACILREGRGASSCLRMFGETCGLKL